MKRAHGSSKFDKEQSSNIIIGTLKDEIQIVPAKTNIGVSKKVTNKKGKKGKCWLLGEDPRFTSISQQQNPSITGPFGSRSQSGLLSHPK